MKHLMQFSDYHYEAKIELKTTMRIRRILHETN